MDSDNPNIRKNVRLQNVLKMIKLLLVDDEPLLLKLMTAVLKSAGYVVETAGTADAKSARDRFNRR